VLVFAGRSLFSAGSENFRKLACMIRGAEWQARIVLLLSGAEEDLSVGFGISISAYKLTERIMLL
jgi:hypothetical protein